MFVELRGSPKWFIMRFQADPGKLYNQKTQTWYIYSIIQVTYWSSLYIYDYDLQ